MANFWYALAAGCGAGTVVTSVGILAWQAFQWFEFGLWPEVPTYYALDYFARVVGRRSEDDQRLPAVAA